MKTPDNAIVSTTARRDSVEIELASGVVIHVSSNPNYLHLSFSRIKDGILVRKFDATKLKLSNYVDIEYEKAGD